MSSVDEVGAVRSAPKFPVIVGIVIVLGLLAAQQWLHWPFQPAVPSPKTYSMQVIKQTGTNSFTVTLQEVK